MLSSKLIEILKTFSDEEYKQFTRFAGAVYFNKGRNYTPLIKILKTFRPDFSSAKLTKSFLSQKLFKGKKYNDQLIRNQLSGLQKICEQFLVFNKIYSNKTDYRIILADELNSRTLYRLSEIYINKSLKEYDKPDIDKDYFRRKFELMQVKGDTAQGLNNTKSAIDCLSVQAEDFFLYYLLETSRQVEEMVVFNHNLNANFKEHITFKLIENLNLEIINKYFTRSNYSYRTAAELFGIHLKLLVDYKNEILFEKFRKKLNENFNYLSRWGKYNMYLCLENACIRLQEIDEIKYRTILFEIYKDQLRNRLYNSTDSSPIAIDMFRNIVINALRVKQFKWVESFIQEYIQNLPAGQIDNMYNFTHSLLNFERKRYEASLGFLRNLKLDTFVFKFDVKVLSLMIYYELGYIEEAISMLDAFRHFINDNLSISNYIKEIHFNFIKYLHEIIRLNDTGNKAEAQRLKSELQNSQVRNREWLMEKISPWF